jgi:hypothetical protein
MRKSDWYAVTPLRVGGAPCGALDAGLFRLRCRFFFAYLSSESIAALTYDHVPKVRLATNPSTESLARRLTSVTTPVARFSFLSLHRAATWRAPLSFLGSRRWRYVNRTRLGVEPADVGATLTVLSEPLRPAKHEAYPALRPSPPRPRTLQASESTPAVLRREEVLAPMAAERQVWVGRYRGSCGGPGVALR